MRNLSFYLDISVSFENSLRYYFNLFYSLFCFTKINWFFYDFLDFNVFFLTWNLYWLLYFNDFISFNYDLFIIFNLYNFLFI